ncbi:MAG: tRNA-dihydrouridine synthase [Bacteroidales bacterium]|nr:tRNA-dihydrouridine synthase [Bacteroidales bacterium]
MDNFWTLLPKPVFTLAPMEDVTDTSFRQLVMEISDPRFFHVIFTEFTSTDGLCHPVGRPNVISRLMVNDTERAVLRSKGMKIVAQVWGANPEKFYEATRLICAEMQFDGIDINMGCPVKKIVKQGGCSALIGQPALAAEIIKAAKEASNIPVSIKTRTGLKKHDTENWIGFLLEQDPAAIILHARTQKDQSEVDADWREIAKAVGMRNQSGKNIPIIGNGDVMSVEDALQKCVATGADGVMVGRGIFHNPWFFNLPQPEITVNDKLELLWHHVDLFTKTWGTERNFATLKRFFKIYTNAFKGAARLRAALMETNNAGEVRRVLNDFKIETQSDDLPT